MTYININTTIRTIVPLKSEFSDRTIPSGTKGTVVECYPNPEGYAVDLALSDETFVGGFVYENMILSPHQFVIVEPPQLSTVEFSPEMETD